MNDNLENERGITIKTIYDNEDKIVEKEVIKVNEHTTVIYTKYENSFCVAIIGEPNLTSTLLSEQISKILESDNLCFDTESTGVDLSIIGNNKLSSLDLLFGDLSEAEFIKQINLDYKEPDFRYNYFEDKKYNRFIDKSKRIKSNKKRK